LLTPNIGRGERGGESTKTINMSANGAFSLLKLNLLPTNINYKKKIQIIYNII
jgi:hypothetical protein